MYWKITPLCISLNWLSHLFRLETGITDILYQAVMDFYNEVFSYL